MKSLLIPCPECGKELRLRDRSLLGKKGRCPTCRHSFILEEPEEVALELAQSASRSASGSGASTQWPSPQPAYPQQSPMPQQAPSHFQPSQAPQHQQYAAAPQPAATFTPAPDDDLSALAQVAQPDGGVARLKELRRKNAKRRNAAILMGTITALTIAGVVYAIQSHTPKAVDAKPELAEGRVAEKEQIAGNADLIQYFNPTPGEPQPVQLLYVPFGARIIFHLRPADLWQSGRMEELRYCFSDVGLWAEAQLKEICRREPAQIEEALICLIPGQKGQPPQVSAVVRLLAEEKKSSLIQEFTGTIMDSQQGFAFPVTVGEKYAYLFHDLRTIAICPAEMASEMADAHRGAHPQTDGIDELMFKTDRRRHLTIVFEPRDVRTHDRSLVPPEALPILNLFLDYFSDDAIETVAWSFHFGENELHSEILMRNRPEVPPSRLQREMKQRLDSLPQQLVEAVGKMQPTELGKRKLIGRFPAYMKAFAMKTLPGAQGEDRMAQLVTLLPERAAPNLVLSGLLAWHQSTVTDFSRKAGPAGPTQPSDSGLPDKIADRLKLPIVLEFNRTPLQEAFAYIAEEAKVNIEIDGDALKLSGYTKNMPQTFVLGKVPAINGIAEILKKYDQMCIIVDEEQKLVTVMTKAVAADKGLTPYPVP